MSVPAALNRGVILTQCRVTAERHLAQAMDPVLDAAAGLLRRLAEQAADMHEREPFMVAASRLANQRDAYHGGFRKGYADRFDTAAKALLRGGPGWEEVDRETAAMLRTNVLENEVAIIKLGVRLKEAARDELAQLSARLVTLFKLHELDDGDNPLGPGAIAHGVYAGLVAARIEGKAARALRPMLEDRLPAPVRDLYRGLNQVLESLGITPHASAGAAPAPQPAPQFAPLVEEPVGPAPAISLAGETAAARKVASMIRGRGTAEALLPFLRHTWVRVIACGYDAGGENGPAWQAGVNTLEELLWSVEAKPTPEQRARLRTLLPDLLRKLDAGMAQVALPHAARAEARDALMSLHRPLLQEPPRPS